MGRKINIFCSIFLLFGLFSHHVNGVTDNFTEYFSKKTVDEIRYTIRTLEKETLKIPCEPEIHGYNRTELIDYIEKITENTIYKDIEEFQKAVILPSAITIKNTLIDEKGFLVLWTINAEKYHRMKRNQSYLIGGIMDYGNLLSQTELKAKFENLIEQNIELLNDEDKLKQYVLNIYPGDYPESTQVYIRTKSKDELFSLYVQMELYLVEIQGIATELYTEKSHDELANQDQTVLLPIIYSFIRKYDILSLTDDFVRIIENRDYKYISSNSLLSKLTDDDLVEYATACEKYHKKFYEQTKSLRNLKDYLKQIPKTKKINYVTKQLNIFPELYQEQRIKDIIENDKSLNYGQISDFLQSNPRDNLIKYYLNIKTLGNSTIYDETLNYLFRMKDKDIIAKITQIITDNVEFQNKETLINVVNLNHGIVKNFMNIQPRTNLLKLSNDLFDYHKKVSNEQLLTKKEEDNLKDFNWHICETHSFYLMNVLRKELENVKQYMPVYGNIFDFLNSINQKTLTIWLRNFEWYVRKKKNYNNIMGGAYFSYNNDTNLEKTAILNSIMNYIDMYPELQKSEKFIELIKLNYKEYPFNWLLKLDNDTLYSYARNLDGYRRRKSPQLVFNDDYNTVYQEKDVENARFFIMKIMAMFPELNIESVINAQKIKEYPENVDDFLGSKSVSELKEYATKFQAYHNLSFNANDTTSFEKFDKQSLIFAIKKYEAESPQLKNNKVNFMRVIYGEKEMLVYDHYDSFLRRQSKETLQTIYNNIQEYIKKVYDIELDSIFEDKEELIKQIKESIINFSDLQDPTIFDKVIDIVKDEEALSVEPRGMLMKYALSCQLFDSIKDKKYDSIDQVVHVMTKNELIRYINEVLNYYSFSFDSLKMFMEKNYINYGEELVQDLAEY